MMDKMDNEFYSVELVFSMQVNFRNNGHKAFPGLAHVRSKYLRENSLLCLSGDGKLYKPIIIGSDYSELRPLGIEEIESIFQDLYHDAKPVFDALKHYPDLLHQFRELYKND